MSETSKTKKKFEINKKWGAEISKVGFTQVPNILFEKQKAMGVNATQMMILINLMSYQWKADELPWPSAATLADKMDLQVSAIRKNLKKLEEMKFIIRVSRYHDGGGQMSNEYDLSPLREYLESFAKEKNKQKRRHKAESKSLASRKKV